MTDTMKTLPVPCVHTNGSGATALRDQAKDVYRAAHQLLDAMRQARPHGRDYYPLGANALKDAQDAHAAYEAMVYAVETAYAMLGVNIQRAAKGQPPKL